MSVNIKSRTTIQDLAKLAGVAKSTVSDVINNRTDGNRVSDKTRQRILAIARELNYTPQASARALSTGKTYHIGFLLSDKTNMGLANGYFAMIMAGVQNACQTQGYNCTVSTYDMTTVVNFVMPPKLQQRSVDGVVLTGFVEAGILEMFMEKQIPFVMVGDNTDFPLRGLLAVARDVAGDYVNIFKHLTDLGHRRIEVCGLLGQRGEELLNEGIVRFQSLYPSISLTVSMPKDGTLRDQFEVAFEYGQAWSRLDSKDRATAILSHDQWCTGFLSAIQKQGGRCPRDVSVLCIGDTTLCKWFNPGITAIDMGVYECGYQAASLLVDLLEHRVTLAEAYRQTTESWKPGRLVIRESTGAVPEADKKSVG